MKLRETVWLLVLSAALLFAACGKAGVESSLPFKIGIVTGTVSQGEDELRAAEALKREFPGAIRHATYPDNFMQEQDTTISQIVGLASDLAVDINSEKIEPPTLEELEHLLEERCRKKAQRRHF